jgi:hypothetical protein
MRLVYAVVVAVAVAAASVAAASAVGAAAGVGSAASPPKMLLRSVLAAGSSDADAGAGVGSFLVARPFLAAGAFAVAVISLAFDGRPRFFFGSLSVLLAYFKFNGGDGAVTRKWWHR